MPHPEKRRPSDELQTDPATNFRIRRIGEMETDLKQRVVVYAYDDANYLHRIVVSSPSGREQVVIRLSEEESQELADILLENVQDARGESDHNDEVVT